MYIDLLPIVAHSFMLWQLRVQRWKHNQNAKTEQQEQLRRVDMALEATSSLARSVEALLQSSSSSSSAKRDK